MAVHAPTQELEDGLSGTAAFIYKNSYWLVVISLIWALTSLLVVTIGPATLGAYVAIRDLDSDRNRINASRVINTVRQQLVPATAFGLLPPVFYGITAGYLYLLFNEFTAYRLGIMIAAFYVGLYLSLVLVPTFFELSRGKSGWVAFWSGVRWVAAHPTSAMLMGLMTLALLVVTTVFTISFALLYAGVTFSIQIRLVDRTLS